MSVWKDNAVSTMQARLNAGAVPAMETNAEGEILLEPHFDEKGLHFGPYSADPVRGLHFDTKTDTAAS